MIDKRKLSLDRNYELILNQLRTEIEVLKKLKHENIVKLRDVIETRQTIYIITEYVSGGELFHHIVENGPLKEEEAKMVMLGVFSAVNHLHEKGIVHRDIKAENILISRQHGKITGVKLIDFGFSKVMKHKLAGSFLGTGGYIAPEIRQQKQYSRSVDMWACGVLLYATLSGRLPFSPATDLLPSKLGTYAKDFLVDFLPSELWLKLSFSVKSLVQGLLQVDPMQRMTIKEAMIHQWFGIKKDSPARKLIDGGDSAYSLPQSMSLGHMYHLKTPPSSRIALDVYCKKLETSMAEESDENKDKNDENYDDKKFKRLEATGKTGSSFTGSTDSCNTGSTGSSSSATDLFGEGIGID